MSASNEFEEPTETIAAAAMAVVQTDGSTTLNALKEATKKQKPAKPEESNSRMSSAKAERMEVDTEGLRGYYRLREKWSTFMMVVLPIVTAFQMALIALVGTGVLKFQNHEVFLNTVAGELFLQIVAMCGVIIKCLFPGVPPKEKDKGKGKGKSENKEQ